MTRPSNGEGDAQEPVVVTDKRRIDPETGAAREVPADDAGTGPAAEAAEPAVETEQVPMVEAMLLEERTADLQRLQAEYANYRRRAERERLAAAEAGAGRVLADLLPVLDDLDLARQHGDLTGGLKSVADTLESVLTKAGLVRFGVVGDPFDPNLHEALLHGHSAEVTTTSVDQVAQAGYRIGDRVVRAAKVTVLYPE